MAHLGRLVDLRKTRVWKAGAGDGRRSFSELCLKHDMFAAGPGEPGSFSKGTPYLYRGREKEHIRQLYEDVQRGDVMVLRVGVSRVEGIGIVEDNEPVYDAAWSDVDGWDIRHTRRVRWITPGINGLGEEGFGAQGATLTPLKDARLLGRLAHVDVDSGQLSRPLAPRPAAGKPLDVDRLVDRLIANGHGLRAADELRTVLQHLGRLVRWYEEEPEHEKPSERETLAYLAAPFLHALGWTHQLLAVEWNVMDAVLFGRLPRRLENVRAIVEAKRLGSSLRTATDQAERYVAAKSLPDCKNILVTDGPRWAVRTKSASGAWRLNSYLNLMRPMDRYPVLGDDVQGAVEAFQAIMK